MVEYPLYPKGYLIPLGIRNFSALPSYSALFPIPKIGAPPLHTDLNTNAGDTLGGQVLRFILLLYANPWRAFPFANWRSALGGVDPVEQMGVKVQSIACAGVEPSKAIHVSWSGPPQLRRLLGPFSA